MIEIKEFYLGIGEGCTICGEPFEDDKRPFIDLDRGICAHWACKGRSDRFTAEEERLELGADLIATAAK